MPRIVTRIATPSADATCRLVLTIADPVPNRSAGSAVALVLISVGQREPDADAGQQHAGQAGRST